MKVTKQQLRQMACVIGGGHKYADTDLLVAVDTKKKVCEYSNKCARCGKEYHVEVPLEYVLPENLTDTYRKMKERKKMNRMEADIVRFKENSYWNPNTHICYSCKHFGECRTHSFMVGRLSVVECNRFEKE